jgi:hypothetical protein
LVDLESEIRNYRVYANPIKIYKNIDNTLRLVFKNRDQKRVNINGYTFTFYLFKTNSPTKNVYAQDNVNFAEIDYDNINVKEPVLVKSVSIQDDGVTPARKGVATVVIPASDINGFVPDSYLFSIKAVNEFGEESPVYSDDNLGVSGIAYLIDGVYSLQEPQDYLDLGTLE